MATRKAKKDASKTRKVKDLSPRATASVKGGAKGKYDVKIDGQTYQLTKTEMENIR